jgi:hypothetical protein
MRHTQRLAIALTACAIGAHAHLKQGSLYPKGGESFAIGQKVTIAWVQTQGHDGLYDLYFSKNAGTSWSEFAGHWQGPKGDGDSVKYEWTVPANSATTQGVIRVCQLAGGECKDAVYILKSGNFTITTASAVEAQAPQAAGKLDFDAATGSLAVAFTLASASRVSLQAFDSQGRLLATLLDAEQAAGEHALSLFSNRLASMHGAVAFKLAWGGASLTRSLILP